MITVMTAAEAGENARAFLAAVSVAPEVFELRPDYRVLVMAAEGLEPGPPDQASDELLARAETRARTALDGRAPEDVPQVAAWRDAYRAFGAKPQRTRPSVEALLRRLDAGLPRIDRLTDAYNAVSIANLVPVGGEDLDQYQGPARLVRAAGDEDFGTTAHGEPATEHPRPGEVIWRDDAGVTCRQWNWRQCTRTRITPATIERRLHHRRARRARTRRPDRSGERPRQLPCPAEPEGRRRQPHHRRPAPRQQENTRMRPTVVMSVIDDYAYIPTTWRTKAGGPDEDGVPTSYYSAVQLTCRTEIVDDPQDKAELLRRQLAHFQPQGDHAQVAVDMPPYGRMLSGIRGLRLHITGVAAKFKYDDKPARTPRPGRRTPPKPRNRPGPLRSRPATLAPP